MTYVKWEDAYDRKLLALKHPERGTTNLFVPGGLSFEQIARRMNAWFATDIFTKDNVQKRYKSVTPPPSTDALPLAVPTPYYSKYFNEYGKLREPAPEKMDLGAYIGGLEESGRFYKTLVLADQQGCFAREDLIKQATDDHPDVDLIAMPGDVVEWYEASRYLKDRDIPLSHEMDWMVRHLEAVSLRYPGVPIVITDSNHRRRVANAVRQLPSGLLPLVEANPERYLAQPFANVFAIERWWWQCGDAIYNHAEGPTANAGDNAKAAIDAFILKLFNDRENVRQFRVVVTGHAHKLFYGMHKTILGIEPGTLADPILMGYTTAANALRTVQEQGYAVVVQKGGRADLNACKAYVLGRD